MTDSASLFCLPANLPGEMVYTDDGDELPPGSVPLNSIKANSILYCGFLIPLSEYSHFFIISSATCFVSRGLVAYLEKWEVVMGYLMVPDF